MNLKNIVDFSRNIYEIKITAKLIILKSKITSITRRYLMSTIPENVEAYIQILERFYSSRYRDKIQIRVESFRFDFESIFREIYKVHI